MMEKINFPNSAQKLTLREESILTTQLHLEFGLVPETKTKLAKIDMYPWHFKKHLAIDLISKRYTNLYPLPLYLAMISTPLKELDDLDLIYKKYLCYVSLPMKISFQLFELYQRFFVIPNYDILFKFCEKWAGKLSYLTKTEPSHTTFLTASVKDMLENKSRIASFERLEKALGILWTSDMVTEHDHNIKEDFFFMPLALSLSQNSEKFYKLIKGALRKTKYEEEMHPKSSLEPSLMKRAEEMAINAGAKVKKKDKNSFSDKDEAVNVYRHNTSAESLIQAPKEVFKQLFDEVYEKSINKKH